jgi:hypothetical protein
MVSDPDLIQVFSQSELEFVTIIIG